MLGTRDYMEKSGFQRAVVGLSGGIDSALTAAIAVDAMGRDNVIGVGMPSRYSSEGSVTDARRLAENLGIQFHTIPIEGIFSAAESSLAPVFEGREADVTEEKHPGPGARDATHGALQQVRRSPPDDGQQERARRRVLHAVRRHVGRAWP